MTHITINPAHPGEIIKEDVLPHFGLSISEAAERLQVARPNFSNVLNGKTALSAELALKLEAVFGVSADLLTNIQGKWDLAQARRNPGTTQNLERLPQPA